jgi:2-dehydro-3-deoxygluconokinase
MFELRNHKEYLFDEISLGEIMLRLDPGEARIRTTRDFSVWEGGGEYNVARGLRKVFGLNTAVVTGLVRNEIGALLEDLIMQGGVDTRYIKWREDDGIGRTVRNGLNFTERGYGIRGALGASDRGNTAASQLKVGDFDWDLIFSQGVRWLHTGGIFAGLSDSTAEVVEEALISAKKYGTKISYDLNYRPSLWKSIGGQEKAIAVNSRLAKFVDVMIGNEEDFIAALGFSVENHTEEFSDLKAESYAPMFAEVHQKFPNIELFATTLREVISASSNNWSAIGWSPEGGLVSSRIWSDLAIFDRVGGGDSFASGLIYGLLSEYSIADAVNVGAAHGALAMTTPGDTSMASKDEVLKAASGGSARVQR